MAESSWDSRRAPIIASSCLPPFGSHAVRRSRRCNGGFARSRPPLRQILFPDIPKGDVATISIRGPREAPSPSLQRSADLAVIGRELGAHALHRGDDRDGDTRSDQAASDGGRAGLVSQKFVNGFHETTPARILKWRTESALLKAGVSNFIRTPFSSCRM